MNVVCCAGRGLWDVPIPSPGKPDQCLVCVTRYNNNPVHLKWEVERGQNKKERKNWNRDKKRR